MADTQPPPPLPKSQPSFGKRHSTIIKLLGVGALVLVREGLVAAATLGLAAAGARRIDVQWVGKAGTLALMFALPGFLLIDVVGPGAAQDVIRVLTWCFTVGGLALSYYAVVAYVPLARAALAEGRQARAGVAA